MTGRRARPTYEQRMSRAMQFVPGHVGGRVASAQPVQRTGGTLRRPSIGATATPLSLLGSDTTPSVDGTTGIDVASYATTLGLAAGDTAVAVCVGIDTGWSAPAGWTTLGSGTVGTLLDWMACYLVLDGTDSFAFGTPNLSGGWTYGADGEGVAMVLLAGFTGGTAAIPQLATPLTETSATTHPLASPGSWTQPLQVVGTMQGTTGTPHHTVQTDPSGLIDDIWGSSISGTPARSLHIEWFDSANGAPTSGDILTVENASPWTTPMSCPSVSLALGFA